MTAEVSPPPNELHYIRSRITNACDGCKARKVKCDGRLPCSYCARRQRPELCHYSPQKQRQRQRQRQKQVQAQRGHPRRREDRAGRGLTSPLRGDDEGEYEDEEDDGRHRQRRKSLPPRVVVNHGVDGREVNTRNDSSNTNPQAGARNGAGTRNGPGRSSTGTNTPATNRYMDGPGAEGGSVETPATQPVRPPMDTSPEDDTEVPREARLLLDAQGKLLFIGDCAPLSLFQSIRQLVTTKVAHDAFAPQTSRYSVLENAPSRSGNAGRHGNPRDPFGQQCQQQQQNAGGAPEVRPADVHGAVEAYLTATAGLVDLFDDGRLADDLVLWANLARKPDDQASLVNYLVLAIGRLTDDEDVAQGYFEWARGRAYADLLGSGGNLGVGTVQVHVLVTLYMLCSCQVSGAFLCFGVAVRAAYSVGLHRGEVNARFGHEAQRQRDRLWKSVRVVDLFLSTSMGRPPATSDVDCTVPYGSSGSTNVGSGSGLGNGLSAPPDLLDASVQILLIIEGIVVQIYSRKKISLQLTEGVSLQLRDWSERWLGPLKDALEGGGGGAGSDARACGACQVLSSYYYAVMLVTRPFLMYELCRRLSDGPSAAAAAAAATATAPTATGGGTTATAAAVRPGMPSGKSKLADACIDAASLMVDPILDLVDRGVLNGRVPMLVSWLFASSLVLGVGLLGGFGRILEKYTRMSIQGLDHFAKHDTHARQYSLVAQSLLTTALEYLEKRELQERMRRTESSSQLFGLIPHETRAGGGTSSPAARHHHYHRTNSAMGSQAVSPATSNTTPTATPRVRDVMDRPAFLQQGPHNPHNYQYYGQHQGSALGPHSGAASPARLGDIDTAFLGLTESLLQTPDANYWNGNFGTDGDMGSALNLFPLLDAGGGIDLAHYLGSGGLS